MRTYTFSVPLYQLVLTIILVVASVVNIWLGTFSIGDLKIISTSYVLLFMAAYAIANHFTITV